MQLYDIAERFVGIQEVDGTTANPQILAMLKLDAAWTEDDETPWCSAFINYCAWLMRLPRSKSLRARSWLDVGTPISIDVAEQGWDVVILKRGGGDQPGPEVQKAPGHVGMFTSREVDSPIIWILGGNQGDAVSVKPFPATRLLGVRRLKIV